MTETTADRFRRLATSFTTVIDSVPADRWDAATPCEGWTVADVVDHVASTQRDFLERMELATGDQNPDAPADADRLRAAWRASSAALQAALDDEEVVGRTYDGYFGPTTIGETVDTFYASDLVVHAWDVARGAGLPELEPIPPADLDRIQAQMASVGDAVRSPGIYGPEVPVPDDASAQDRFLAWTGRQP